MLEIVKSRIETKRREAAAAMERALSLASELRGMEELQRDYEAMLAAKPTLSASLSTSQQTQALSGSGLRRRGINSTWRKIIAEAALKHPDGLVLDEWELLAGRLGESINRNTLRSQMSNYGKAGFVERVGYGKFRVTNPGAQAAGVRLGAGKSGEPIVNAPQGDV